MGNACISHEGAPHQSTTTTSSNSRCQGRNNDVMVPDHYSAACISPSSNGDVQQRAVGSVRYSQGVHHHPIVSAEVFVGSQIALAVPQHTAAPPAVSLPLRSATQDSNENVKCSHDELVYERPSSLRCPAAGTNQRSTATSTCNHDRHRSDADKDEALASREGGASDAQTASHPEGPFSFRDDSAFPFTHHVPSHAQQHSALSSQSTLVTHPRSSSIQGMVRTQSCCSDKSSRGSHAAFSTATSASLLLRCAAGGGESVGGSAVNNESLLSTPRGDAGGRVGGPASMLALFCPPSADLRNEELIPPPDAVSQSTGMQHNDSQTNSESLGAFLQALPSHAPSKGHEFNRQEVIPNSRGQSSLTAASPHLHDQLVAFPRANLEDDHPHPHRGSTTSPNVHLAFSAHSSPSAMHSRMQSEWFTSGGMSLHSDGRAHALLASMSTWSQTGAGEQAQSYSVRDGVISLPKFSTV